MSVKMMVTTSAKRENTYNRRSIRLRGYDYSQSGAYFITICTNNKRGLFGNVVDGEMVLNSVGEIVRDEWLRTEAMRYDICMDVFIVMPNHLHGIIMIGRRGELHSPVKGHPQDALSLRGKTHN
ncbi:MAG: hypothetical protein WCJ49_05150 [Deltaproteobacteria bacterium]